MHLHTPRNIPRGYRATSLERLRHHGLPHHRHQVRWHRLSGPADGKFTRTAQTSSHRELRANVLNLHQGMSYSTSAITVPSLKLLPTSAAGSRCIREVKRLNRKHALRLSGIANSCFLFAFTISPPRRKHPYLVWVCLISTLGSYGLDLFFNRHMGLKNWALAAIQDTTGLCLGGKPSTKKDDDLVVVEAEEDVNGESVQREMDNERRLGCARAWMSAIALSMGIVGLWGDKK